MAAAWDVAFRIAAPTARLYSSSGRWALVKNAKGFILVPWRPVVERALGREVVGLVTGGGISWQIGRDRGVSL